MWASWQDAGDLAAKALVETCPIRPIIRVRQDEAAVGQVSP